MLLMLMTIYTAASFGISNDKLDTKVDADIARENVKYSVDEIEDGKDIFITRVSADT